VRPPVLPAPRTGGVVQVDPVGGGILAYHQELLHPGADQPLGLAQHRPGGARDPLAAHLRNNAEPAGMVAAFGDLQVGEVARRQLHADLIPGRRNQVDLGVRAWRHRGMDRVQNLLVLLRPGDRQHRRVGGADRRRLGAEAAGDDHPSVGAQRLADRLQALGLGAVEETAGVDDHRLGPCVVGRDRVVFGPQPGENPLGIDQRLRATERDHADAGLSRVRCIAAGPDGGGDVGAQIRGVPVHGPSALAHPDRRRQPRGAARAAVRQVRQRRRAIPAARCRRRACRCSCSPAARPCRSQPSRLPPRPRHQCSRFPASC